MPASKSPGSGAAGSWWHTRISTAPRAGWGSAAARDIGAFIFDVDGVLADTAELHWQAWQETAGAEGVLIEPGLKDALRGISREASLRLILGDRVVSTEKFVEMMNRKNACYLERLHRLNRAAVLPGVVEMLVELSRRGIRLAAASSSRNAEQVLKQTGLARWMRVIVDGRWGAAPKPSPELFLKAAARLRVAPWRCIVVEDAAAGVAAARAGGMRSVGIGDPSQLPMATIVVPNLAGLDVNGLLRRLGRAGTSCLSATMRS